LFAAAQMPSGTSTNQQVIEPGLTFLERLFKLLG
jgi:hypothetical protein